MSADTSVPEQREAGLDRSESWLSEAVLQRCALRVAIPTSRAVESLNVAAAAAVCLFERKRRQQR